MADQQSLIPVKRIERVIIVLRGQKVMLSRDLATLMRLRDRRWTASPGSDRRGLCHETGRSAPHFIQITPAYTQPVKFLTGTFYDTSL
jgi:hypothetical protein